MGEVILVLGILIFVGTIGIVVKETIDNARGVNQEKYSDKSFWSMLKIF